MLWDQAVNPRPWINNAWPGPQCDGLTYLGTKLKADCLFLLSLSIKLVCVGTKLSSPDTDSELTTRELDSSVRVQVERRIVVMAKCAWTTWSRDTTLGRIKAHQANSEMPRWGLIELRYHPRQSSIFALWSLLVCRFICFPLFRHLWYMDLNSDGTNDRDREAWLVVITHAHPLTKGMYPSESPRKTVQPDQALQIRHSLWASHPDPGLLPGWLGHYGYGSSCVYLFCSLVSFVLKRMPELHGQLVTGIKPLKN